MKTRSLIVALSALLVAGRLFAATSPTAGTTNDPAVEKELLQLEQAWGKAYAAKDLTTLARIEADNFTFVDPEGVVNSKAQDIESVRSGEFVTKSFSIDDTAVRIYGDAAVITGRTTMSATYKDKDISGQYRWTDTWVKRNGQWQCVASQAAKIAKP